MRKIIISAFTVLCLALAINFLKDARLKPEADAIIFGTNAEFPPYEFLRKGQLVGFDIDLISNISARIHKKVVIKNMEFDSLLLEAQTGRIHVIAAGLTPTPERAKKLIFTKPYANEDPLVAITLSRNPIKSLEELYGKEVIVNDGYSSEIFIKKHPLVELKKLPSPGDAFMALTSGRGYAFVTALSSAKSFIEHYGKDAFSILNLNVSESAALGISQQHPSLLPILQKALDDMENDGTLIDLKKKWKLL